MENGDAEEMQYRMSVYLSRLIGVRDFMTRHDLRESFYHGIIAGMISGSGEWEVRSNEEAGKGYSDVLLRNFEKRTGIVLEFKYSERESSMEADAEEALRQMDQMEYDMPLRKDGMKTILKYAIAFRQKRCRILRA